MSKDTRIKKQAVPGPPAERRTAWGEEEKEEEEEEEKQEEEETTDEWVSSLQSLFSHCSLWKDSGVMEGLSLLDLTDNLRSLLRKNEKKIEEEIILKSQIEVWVIQKNKGNKPDEAGDKWKEKPG